MTNKQKLFLGVLFFMGAVVVLGSTWLSSGAFLVLFVAAAAVVALFKDRITPTNPSPPSPLQILERSRLWKGVAIAYTTIIIVVVVWHLFVSRLAFFDDVSLPVGLLLLLGPAIGPIMKNIMITYRMLGSD